MNKLLSREFLVTHREQLIKAIAVIVIIAVAFFVFTGKGGDEEDAAAVSGEPGQTEAVQEQGGEVSSDGTGTEAGAASAVRTSGKILVDVSGAVNYPKVVELPQGSRVQDAIDAAGGLKKRADISGINRAAEVQDGEKIDIPFRNRNSVSTGSAYSEGVPDDTYGGASSSASSYDTAGGMVNINTAGSEQLQTLTGIGPALAERIISYREQNGAFMSIEEIKNVSGIGDKTFEKFKDRITT